jgi:hypothetical protein
VGSTEMKNGSEKHEGRATKNPISSSPPKL